MYSCADVTHSGLPPKVLHSYSNLLQSNSENESSKVSHDNMLFSSFKIGFKPT